MQHKILTSLILLCISPVVFSQCDEFIIYRTKGDVTLQPGSIKGNLLKNKRLNDQSLLNVSHDGYVILLSGTEKALRIGIPGTYSYGNIRTTCQKNQTTLTTEYLRYVAQSIMEKEEPLTAMVIKGAVYRTRKSFESTDMILPSDSSVISSDIIRFSWHPTPGNTSKYLKIYENGVKEIYSKLHADTTVIVGSELFKPKTLYFWLVSVNLKPTDDEVRFNFVYAEKNWKTEFIDNEEVWMKELEGELNATEKKIKK